eukprot:g7902.t1
MEASDGRRCGGKVLPPAGSRETEDRNHRPCAATASSQTVGDCADGRRDGGLGSGKKNSASNEGEAAAAAAAVRRYCLSKPHLENLVASSRILLAEEEEHLARESSEQRDCRARNTGYLIGCSRDRIEEIESRRSRAEGRSDETTEAFARRCLAESRKITA